MTSAELQKCSCCGLNYDFQLETFLLDEVANGNVVVFAGAGISTENKNSAPHTLYTALAVGLGRPDCDLSFPDLAEAFCALPDGRFRMMQIIQNRFDYIAKFRDLRDNANKFFN